jgi:hypothetical protein
VDGKRFDIYKNSATLLIMTKTEVKEARKDIQKLIKENKKQLMLLINKKHPKLIRLIKKNFDCDRDTLLDADFYEEIEYFLPQRT